MWKLFVSISLICVALASGFSLYVYWSNYQLGLADDLYFASTSGVSSENKVDILESLKGSKSKLAPLASLQLAVEYQGRSLAPADQDRDIYLGKALDVYDHMQASFSGLFADYAKLRRNMLSREYIELDKNIFRSSSVLLKALHDSNSGSQKVEAFKYIADSLDFSERAKVLARDLVKVYQEGIYDAKVLARKVTEKD